ncbi:MAG: hypothetical protein ACAH88_08795 [Roseimicrobium sp.]
MNPHDPAQPADGSASPEPKSKSAKVTVQSLSPTSQGIPAAPPVYESRPVQVPVQVSASVHTTTAATHPAPMASPLPSMRATTHTASSSPGSLTRKLAKYWYAVGGGSLLLSLTVHAVLLVLAYFVITTMVNPEKPVDFLPGGGSTAGDDASRDLAHMMKQKKFDKMRKSVPIQKIVSKTGLAGIKLPDLEMDIFEMPEISTPMGGSMSGGSSGFGGTGAGGGGGGGRGIGMAKGFAPMTFFGRVGGEGLPGAFYDMKQDRERKALPYSGTFPDYIAVINKAASRKFSPTALKDYYKAQQEVSFTYLMVPNMAATEGPKCFNVEKEVEPRGWFVHYSGMVTPPKSGTYRFVGFFDDLLIVYINNKPVLDGSWVPMAGVGEGKYDEEIRQEFKGPPVAGTRTAYFGKWVKMKEPFKLDIVVGETPGGRVGGLLMVQDKDGKYQERADGTPILPIFTTTKLEADDIKRLTDDPYARTVQFAADPPVFPGKKAIFDEREDNKRGLGLLPERK